MEKFAFFISLFLALLASARMEIVNYEECNNHPDFHCKVTQVRVSPCPEAASDKPCRIKRGKTANIEFDFEPSGEYNDLETKAYWASSTGDLPWIGMDTNGCTHTVCPTSPTPTNFSYNLHIGSKLPVRQYDVKWRLWKTDQMECCFLIKIKLVK